jgi:hypothetical protein
MLNRLESVREQCSRGLHADVRRREHGIVSKHRCRGVILQSLRYLYGQDTLQEKLLVVAGLSHVHYAASSRIPSLKRFTAARYVSGCLVRLPNTA